MNWLCRFATLVLLVVGIVLSPLRAMAATVPMLVTCDAMVGRSYTMLDRHDGASNLRAAAGAGDVRAYHGDVEQTSRREIRPEVAISVVVASIAARGGGAGVKHSLSAINPVGGAANCVNCAVALDAILGGARASALLGKAVPLPQVPGVFGKSAFDGTASSIGGVRSAFGMTGSRGVVVGIGPNGGHAFNVANQGGVVKFLDGQAGTPAVVDGFTKFYYLVTGM